MFIPLKSHDISLIYLFLAIYKMAEPPPASCPSLPSWIPTKEEIFEGGVIAGKLLVMILLVVFAFMNYNTAFICRKPKEFIGEAIAVGVGTAIPVIFIGLRRGASIGSVSSAAFIGFLVFFIFHVLMEFSGKNETKRSGELKRKLDNEEAVLFWPTVAIGGVIALVLGFIAFKVQKFDMCFSEAMLEAAVFGLFNTIPLIWIEYNRGDSPLELTLAFFKYFFAFGAGCMILQAGGFWSRVFPLSEQVAIKYAACDDGTRLNVNSTKTLSEYIGMPSANKVIAKGVPNFTKPSEQAPSGGSLLKSLSGSAEPVTGSLLAKLGKESAPEARGKRLLAGLGA